MVQNSSHCIFIHASHSYYFFSCFVVTLVSSMFSSSQSQTDSAYSGSEIAETDDDNLDDEYVLHSDDTGYTSDYWTGPGENPDSFPEVHLVVHVNNDDVVFENSSSDSENFATSSDEEKLFNWHNYWVKRQRELNEVWYDAASDSETEWYDAEEGHLQ